MRHYSPLEEVNLAAKLADLREDNYYNSLLLDSLIELLVEKGVISREELYEKARHRDGQVLLHNHHSSDDFRNQRHHSDAMGSSATLPPFL
ncbi:MAG: hypothetical protein H0Z34_15645 [Brevibacillus sp.]|nr:hypothetical protein [Brevibacillus sp.]